MTFNDSLDLATLAAFIRGQVALEARPPVGEIQMNNEEAMLCALALEAELKRRDRLAKANDELRALIDFAENEWLDWSEDVAMGGGTGSAALENLAADPVLQGSCAMVDRWKAILAILKDAAERV